jgi:glycosyltransferase involved in cell wall biosynthesis
MTDSRPLVSAVVTTHNRPELLKRALDSVVAQSYPNMELIVVDDGSAESSEAIVESYRDQIPVRFIRNETPKGACKARNLGIENAAGEFVAGLDDDDYWRSGRIEKLTETFEEGISAACSYDRMVMDGREIVWKKPNRITLDDLLYYNRVGNQVLTRKEYLIEVGGYDETLPSAQDYDLWIRLAKRFGPVKTAPHVLQVIHMDEGRDRITNSDEQIRGYYACFEKHKELMSESHIKYQRYRLRMIEGEEVSWLDLFTSVPGKLYLKEITRKLFL